MTNLEQLLDTSVERAGDDLKSLIDQPDRRMSVDEFREFVRSVSLWAMATSSPAGNPHVAPVHLRLTDEDEFEMTIHTKSVRMRDIEHNPHVGFTGWGEGGKMAIIYGRAELIPGSERESTAGGRSKPVATLRIEPDRIYAMDPRRQG